MLRNCSRSAARHPERVTLATEETQESMLTSLPSLNRSFDSHKQRVLWKKDYSKERFTLNC